VEQSPYRKAESRSAGQEIPRSLWKMKIRYRVHSGPHPEP